jgi:hypothetical protein
VRSFSGQGHQIRENNLLARNAGPARTPLNNRGNLNRWGPFRDNPRFGSPFRDRDRDWDRFGFRERCWNCGFGWGFGFGWWPGWGFGWPSFGYWDWGPAWIDPIWGWPGQDYNSYPADYTNDYPYDYNDSYSAQPENGQGSYTPPVQERYSPPPSSDAKVEMPVLLYMKDRSVYAASDYWVEEGKLHYVLSTGAEKMVELDQVDVRRTIAENADLGTQVTLTPRTAPSEPLETPPPTAPTAKPRNKVAPRPTTRS